MPKRYVKNALVRYEIDGARRYAHHGQEIDVPQETIDHLGDQLFPEGHGPGITPEDSAGAAGVPVDLDTGAVEDAASWLNGDLGDKPKASEVVAAANGDVDRAQLLLEAEQSLQGDPRKSVVEPLQQIIDEGGTS
jgi:hypothetical protein